MCEYNVTHHGGSAAAIRALQSALEHLFVSKNALKCAATLKEDKEPKSPCERSANRAGTVEGNERPTDCNLETNFDELRNLVPIIETRLMNVLKELVKAHTALKNKGKGNKDFGGLDTAKRMYSVALRRSGSKTNEDVFAKCQIIAETIENLEEIKKEAS